MLRYCHWSGGFGGFPVSGAVCGECRQYACPDSAPSCSWVQGACTALVALGAAYASYRHGPEFALRFGADDTAAAIWPLIVDDLLATATVELWKTGHGRRAGGRWAAWLAFVFGICLSLRQRGGGARS